MAIRLSPAHFTLIQRVDRLEVLLLVLHGPIATNILNVYSAALAALSMGVSLSRTAIALIVGIASYLVTVYFVFEPSFAKAFDNWMISLLLWMSPFAGVITADFFVKRRGHIDVAELSTRRKQARIATSAGPASWHLSSA